MRAATHESLCAWLDALIERYTLVAPQRVERDWLYRPVVSAADVALDFQRTTVSPKGYFFPETEVLLDVEKRGRDVTLDEPDPDGDQVLFAIRPCDARALRVLDALLLDRPPADSYYARRRERTTLVGLACPEMWAGCFCTSLGSGPADASAVDLMLHADGDGYLVEVVTQKGAALLAGVDWPDTERPVPVPEITADQVPLVPSDAWRARFGEPAPGVESVWQRLADRCLSCHACTYVCPTCRCFDVRDDVTAAGPGYVHIQRLRAWDSCMSPAYRRIAGGHNPRPDTAQRLRNRYFCKFCYSPLDFGPVACVGCGRCIDACPAGVDIVEVLRILDSGD
ncbi:MAG: 4Fe-4S dicluster domain-containing protein [Anaerolineae bacterium]|nr:4Fe-4S dicluster domain-containing protein [Anaerolineae bacterium]